MAKRKIFHCLLWAFFVSIVLLPQTLLADTIKPPPLGTGEKLLSLCFSKERDAKFGCIGYIAGVSDAIINDLIRNTKSSLQACIPRKVLAKKRTSIVLKWLRKHKNVKDTPAATLILWALSEAYPCKK